MRLDLQRRHEDYWAMQWAIPLGQYLNAQIRWSRPDEDPPDAHFHARRHDGTEVMVWGEMTGVYLDEEAKWLWGDEPRKVGGFWREPDAVLGIRAREQVERKRKKYLELARRRGPGHLLVLLLSRLTTRSTRVEVESRLRELLESAPSVDSDPFETVWLGYHLPSTTDEQEDPQHVFRDRADAGRFNFIKRIWIGQNPRSGITPTRDGGI